MINRKQLLIKKVLESRLMRLQEIQLMMEKVNQKERKSPKKSIRRASLSIRERTVRPCSTKPKLSQLNQLKKLKIKKLLKEMNMMSKTKLRIMEKETTMTKRRKV